MARSRFQVLRSRNDEVQLLLALGQNRNKRHRLQQFLVQGTTAIDEAVRAEWPVKAFVYSEARPRSEWAERHLESGVAERCLAVPPDVLLELSDRNEGAELVAVVAMRDQSLVSLPKRSAGLIVVIDRPKSPGNLGTVLRTASAFAVDGVVLTGHAADPYDPACVRSSVGTLFTIPFARVPSFAEALPWLEALRGDGYRLVATGSAGDADVATCDFRESTVLVLGNETRGVGQGYRAACDTFVHIPLGGSTQSLNVGVAAGILLYEVSRQRRAR